MNAIEKQIDSIARHIKIQLDEKKEEGIKIDGEVIFGVVESAVLSCHLFTQKTTPFLIDEISARYKEREQLKQKVNSKEKGILTEKEIKSIVKKIAIKELPNYYS